MQDEKIIELYWVRSQEAISQTDIKYGNYVRKISSNILSDSRDVDECIDDTYLKIWNSIPPQKPDNFKAYIGRIIRNVSINMCEGQRRYKRSANGYLAAYEEMEQIISDNGQNTDVTFEEIYLSNLINRYLMGLSEEKRLIFIGRYWYFDSIKEISDKLQISESKVKTSLLRLRKSLRQYLEEEGINI